MRFILFLLAYLITTPLHAQESTKFGILYSGWHCLVTKSEGARPFSVVGDALAGKRPWGPVPEFHFWGEPRAGFYCLSERPDILRLHAELLRDAGISFIVFDATNAEYADGRSPDALASIVEPFDRLLEVWKGVDGAPKVVPWAPLTAKGDLLEWMVGRLDHVPKLQFAFKGKPLALITQNATFDTDDGKAKLLAHTHTVRRMWGLMPSDRKNWSFLSVCQPGFLAAQARIPCGQQSAIRDGEVEQISIALAYQETYMSNRVTAVPKLGGRTFVRQFETLYDTLPSIALIASWNEWMAQRFCLDSRGNATHVGCSIDNDHWPDGRKVFVDAYDAEYNRDVEPAKDGLGNFYYRLMKHCIAAFRRDERCRETDVK